MDTRNTPDAAPSVKPTEASPAEKRDAAGAAILQAHYARTRELTEQIDLLKSGGALITEIHVHSAGQVTPLRMVDHRALIEPVVKVLERERAEIAGKIAALGFEV